MHPLKTLVPLHLLKQTKQLQRIQSLYDKALPEKFSGKVELGFHEPNTLIFNCKTAGAASNLRFHLPSLTALLHEQPEYKDWQIKIQNKPSKAIETGKTLTQDRNHQSAPISEERKRLRKVLKKL